MKQSDYKLQCPKCQSDLGYSLLYLSDLYCYKCKKSFKHGLFQTLFDQGYHAGSQSKLEEIKAALGME